ncbi:helix-turn-helix domain-containing protein [Novosphingobium panipatense]|uniref:helix-turn-helix domain-containing protein n=1 Tax=Novosphingobium panipatense TaxID=428991 RepID=UPI0039A0BF14
MTTLTLGEATALALGRVHARAHAGQRPRAGRRNGAPHRTGAPVRRDSIEAGTFEEQFFAVPAKGETDRLLRMARSALDTARRLKRAARTEGRALSPAEATLTGMTAAAVRVFEEICTLARLNAGQVFPSYNRLAEATALGRSTVARALTALERAGFLVRQRRFKRVEGEGPRYAQTSNAYRPMAPQRLLRLLPRWMTPAPIPDDAAHHKAEQIEQLAQMQRSLTCRELAETVVGGALGRVLAKLGAAIDRRDMAPQRESQNQSQHLPDSFYSSRYRVGQVARQVPPDGEQA